MRLFRADLPNRPSGLLAQRLFAQPENEITDIEAAPTWRSGGLADVERLDTLEAHRQTLKAAFLQSRRRVLVVSPYLSHAAILADALIPALIDARNRNVRVVIAFDQFLNAAPHGGLKEPAQQALDVLSRIPVELWPLQRAHNKTLAVDDDWIVEGSFNWLSAQRDETNAYQRHETSFLYRGRDAPQHTEKAWAEAAALKEAAADPPTERAFCVSSSQ